MGDALPSTKSNPEDSVPKVFETKVFTNYTARLPTKTKIPSYVSVKRIGDAHVKKRERFMIVEFNAEFMVKAFSDRRQMTDNLCAALAKLYLHDKAELVGISGVKDEFGETRQSIYDNPLFPVLEAYNFDKAGTDLFNIRFYTPPVGDTRPVLFRDTVTEAEGAVAVFRNEITQELTTKTSAAHVTGMYFDLQMHALTSRELRRFLHDKTDFRFNLGLLNKQRQRISYPRDEELELEKVFLPVTFNYHNLTFARAVRNIVQKTRSIELEVLSVFAGLVRNNVRISVSDASDLVVRMLNRIQASTLTFDTTNSIPTDIASGNAKMTLQNVIITAVMNGSVRMEYHIGDFDVFDPVVMLDIFTIWTHTSPDSWDTNSLRSMLNYVWNHLFRPLLLGRERIYSENQHAMPRDLDQPIPAADQKEPRNENVTNFIGHLRIFFRRMAGNTSHPNMYENAPFRDSRSLLQSGSNFFFRTRFRGGFMGRTPTEVPAFALDLANPEIIGRLRDVADSFRSGFYGATGHSTAYTAFGKLLHQMEERSRHISMFAMKVGRLVTRLQSLPLANYTGGLVGDQDLRTFQTIVIGKGDFTAMSAQVDMESVDMDDIIPDEYLRQLGYMASIINVEQGFARAKKVRDMIVERGYYFYEDRLEIMPFDPKKFIPWPDQYTDEIVKKFMASHDWLRRYEGYRDDPAQAGMITALIGEKFNVLFEFFWQREFLRLLGFNDVIIMYPNSFDNLPVTGRDLLVRSTAVNVNRRAMNAQLPFAAVTAADVPQILNDIAQDVNAQSVSGFNPRGGSVLPIRLLQMLVNGTEQIVTLSPGTWVQAPHLISYSETLESVPDEFDIKSLIEQGFSPDVLSTFTVAVTKESRLKLATLRRPAFGSTGYPFEVIWWDERVVEANANATFSLSGVAFKDRSEGIFIPGTGESFDNRAIGNEIPSNIHLLRARVTAVDKDATLDLASSLTMP